MPPCHGGSRGFESRQGRVNKREILLNIIDGATESAFEVVPLHRKREWMTNTFESFAYQCMPLNIANEFGWAVLNPASFTATWGGDQSTDGISVVYHDEPPFDFVSSHFGNGVLTINVDFIIKTGKGVSTYIRSVPNEYITGLHALDAIVETDWLPFTFTYNYQFKDHCSVTFDKSEPLFVFFPVVRKEIEKFDISFQTIDSDPKFAEQYNKYRESRQHILENPSDKFQRFYRDAKDPEGIEYDADDHVKKVMLNKPTRLT